MLTTKRERKIWLWLSLQPYVLREMDVEAAPSWVVVEAVVHVVVQHHPQN
jgi:hypothetical protein